VFGTAYAFATAHSTAIYNTAVHLTCLLADASSSAGGIAWRWRGATVTGGRAWAGRGVTRGGVPLQLGHFLPLRNTLSSAPSAFSARCLHLAFSVACAAVAHAAGGAWRSSAAVLLHRAGASLLRIQLSLCLGIADCLLADGCGRRRAERLAGLAGLVPALHAHVRCSGVSGWRQAGTGGTVCSCARPYLAAYLKHAPPRYIFGPASPLYSTC